MGCESQSGSAWANAEGEGGLQGIWSVLLCSEAGGEMLLIGPD